MLSTCAMTSRSPTGAIKTTTREMSRVLPVGSQVDGAFSVRSQSAGTSASAILRQFQRVVCRNDRGAGLAAVAEVSVRFLRTDQESVGVAQRWVPDGTTCLFH